MHPFRKAANWLIWVTIATAILATVGLLASPAKSTAGEGTVPASGFEPK